MRRHARRKAERRQQSGVLELQLTPEQQNKLAAVARLEQLLGRELTIYRWLDDKGETIDPRQAAAVVNLVLTGSDLTERMGHQAHTTTSLKQAAETLLDGLASWKTAVDALRDVVGAGR